MQTLPWIVALLALALLATGLGTWGWRNSRKPRSPVLPTEWALAARPVFAGDERRVHRLLREALPHHVVLSKLPLVRFCQPTDPSEVRYWYDLLGNSHVTFAICSANGRVLAAIDLDSDRGDSRRRMQIKQSVLSACRVRYLRCAVDQLPSVAELQLLVPNSAVGSRAPLPESATLRPAGTSRGDPRDGGAADRRERTPLWQDSAVLHDSFFALDSRRDSFGSGSPLQADRFGPPSATPRPRVAKTPRRSARPAFDDTDFDPTQFRQGDFGPEAAADDADDFGNLQLDPPRFYSGSRR